MENIYQQQRSANIQAASQRLAKPSAAGLALNLAGAALGGVQAGMALKAPSAGGSGGSGVNLKDINWSQVNFSG